MNRCHGREEVPSDDRDLFRHKFFYKMTERTGSQFRVCLARPYPLYLAHYLSIIPDGETENDLREIWGSFLVARDLHCSLSKAGAEVYLPHFVARQFGLIQTAPLPPLSINRLPSWRADVAQQHGAVDASKRGRRRWKALVRGVHLGQIHPALEEDVRGALKNADWDPLLSKAGKGKKASAAPSRPSTPAAAIPRVAAPPLARTVIATSTAAPTPRAPAVTGARKTLAHRTAPFTSPARPVAAAASGRKRGQEALSTAAATVEAASAESTVVETAALERPRKKVLLDLSDDEVEEEAPSVAVSEAPPATGEEGVEEEAVAEAPGVEEAVAAEAIIQEAADPEELVAEEVVEEVATAEDTETLGVEKVPATEEPAADMPDGELPAMEPTRATLAEVPSAAPVVSSAPRRPNGIVFRLPPRSSLPLSAAVMSMPPAPSPQESVVVTALAVVEAAVTDAPSPPPVSSAVLTELSATSALGAPSATQTTSSDDLEELYASLHEEGGSSTSAPLDEDSRAVVEKLLEFLFFGVHQMTTAEVFTEFRSCLDTTMAMGLLDSAQLDEL
ncbi:unnamed protein product [Prunus armeniaca]